MIGPIDEPAPEEIGPYPALEEITNEPIEPKKATNKKSKPFLKALFIDTLLPVYAMLNVVNFGMAATESYKGKTHEEIVKMASVRFDDKKTVIPIFWYAGSPGGQLGEYFGNKYRE